jgi:hypothetical protein
VDRSLYPPSPDMPASRVAVDGLNRSLPSQREVAKQLVGATVEASRNFGPKPSAFANERGNVAARLVRSATHARSGFSTKPAQAECMGVSPGHMSRVRLRRRGADRCPWRVARRVDPRVQLPTGPSPPTRSRYAE